MNNAIHLTEESSMLIIYLFPAHEVHERVKTKNMYVHASYRINVKGLSERRVLSRIFNV